MEKTVSDGGATEAKNRWWHVEGVLSVMSTVEVA